MKAKRDEDAVIIPALPGYNVVCIGGNGELWRQPIIGWQIWWSGPDPITVRGIWEDDDDFAWAIEDPLGWFSVLPDGPHFPNERECFEWLKKEDDRKAAMRCRKVEVVR